MRKIFLMLLVFVSAVSVAQIDVGTNFNIIAPIPIDTRMTVDDITERNAISQRYEGLTVYVTEEETTYQLIGGITNDDWINITYEDHYLGEALPETEPIDNPVAGDYYIAMGDDGDSYTISGQVLNKYDIIVWTGSAWGKSVGEYEDHIWVKHTSKKSIYPFPFTYNLGLNTTTPSYPLEVNAQAQIDTLILMNGVKVDSILTTVVDDDNSLITAGAVVDYIGSVTSDSSFWLKDGNYLYPKTITDSVGIGVSSPSAILDVGGRIEIHNTGGSVFLGEYAGINDDLTNNENIFIGKSSGYSNTEGRYNAALGSMALRFNTTGRYNVALGHHSLEYPNGIGNIGIGYYAAFGDNATEASYNTAIGTQALTRIKASYNTALGAYAGKNYGGGSSENSGSTYSVFIGYYSRALTNTDINTIVLGANAIGHGTNTATILDDNGTDVWMGENGQATIHASRLGTSASIIDGSDSLVDANTIYDYVQGITGGEGVVTEVTSSTTDQLTITDGTTTPELTIVTGSVANSDNGLITGDIIYDYLGDYLFYPTYSEVYVVSGSGLACLTDTWTHVTGWSSSISNNLTTTSSQFTIDDYGTYSFSISGSFEYTPTGAATSAEVRLAVFLNDVEQTNKEVLITAPNNIVVPFSISGLDNLDASDIITLKVRSNEAGTFTVGYGNMSIHKIANYNAE